MASGQDLLDLMELLNQELQLQTGEENVARGLVALNAAQDAFEGLAALRPKILGSRTGTVTTAANTETTAFPSGLLRVDRLQFIDAGTSRPAWDLDPIRRTGGHTWSRYWPINLVSTSNTGKPRGYWTNGTSIYWDPLPDAVHTVRWNGFSAATAITAAGTFAYPDIVMLPVAAYATRLWKIGLDDPDQALANLAGELFTPVVAQLGNFNRDGSAGFEYTMPHST